MHLAAAHAGAAAEEAAACAIQEAAGKGGGGGGALPTAIHNATAWMVGSTWHWNGWDDVRFDAGGIFAAPTADCRDSACSWASNASHVFVHWADAGLHVLRINRKRNRLRGQRWDGDEVRATLKRG